VGNTNLRAYTGNLKDEPLPDNAERKVLAGDATAEIPQMLAAVRELVQRTSALAAPDGALAGTLHNLQTATARLNGPGGALGVLTGSDADAKKLFATLERTDALLRQATTLAASLDRVAVQTQRQVFGVGGQPGQPGQAGLVGDSRATILQLQGLLTDARATLTRVDGVLAEAQGIAANTRSATTDLGTLRTEVEASLRRVQQLADELNRRWPFARDNEVKLP
jgi:phospholipid/cholesterol/gamma-HCH transport system substrate-binding protein